jgi:two-component system KDP operon response regulator KdpE
VTASAQNPVRLLLVEDEEFNRDLVRAVLSRAPDPAISGAKLTEAPTLADARAALENGEFDVVLLDVQLPDGTGLTLAAELAKTPAETRPAIVILTAGVLPEQRAAALAAGCTTFLEKPYSPSKLIEVLRAQLPGSAVPN